MKIIIKIATLRKCLSSVGPPVSSLSGPACVPGLARPGFAGQDPRISRYSMNQDPAPRSSPVTHSSSLAASYSRPPLGRLLFLIVASIVFGLSETPTRLREALGRMVPGKDASPIPALWPWTPGGGSW